VSFAAKTRKKKRRRWSSPRRGGCGGVLAKFGEAGDAPVAGDGRDIMGRVEAGIGPRLGK
jgi:hypothetical protein